jgi:hypothetical protein
MKPIKTGDKILTSSSPFYFDDCPICRAMKKAEEEGKDLSEEEALEAMEKAKEVGGVTATNKPPNPIDSYSPFQNPF